MPENLNDLDLSALDDDAEGGAPEPAEELPELGEDAEDEPEGDEPATGDDEPEGEADPAKDEIFEALVASGKLKEAEKYVALQEQTRAAAPAKVVEPDGELTDEDLGFGEEAEQMLNAAGYRQQMINQQKTFNETKVAQVIAKGKKLEVRYWRAVESSGADSAEAKELLEDYEEVRQASLAAAEINKLASSAIERIAGVERMVEKVPALRKHTARMVNLVDQGILDPFAPSAQVREVLRKHLPKPTAAKAAANGKAANGKAAKVVPVGQRQPDPAEVRALRQRLGSTRGNASGGASGGQDGDRRAARPGQPRAPKVSRETQAAFDRIAGRTKK